jgi:hypothetical protein
MASKKRQQTINKRNRERAIEEKRTLKRQAKQEKRMLDREAKQEGRDPASTDGEQVPTVDEQAPTDGEQMPTVDEQAPTVDEQAHALEPVPAETPSEPD